MPKIAVPTVPIPVQTAYAVPSGSCLSASPNRPTLPAMAPRVSAEGPGRVKPSVYLRPTAQATSSRPASSRSSQEKVMVMG
jgi:hypothetical protein